MPRLRVLLPPGDPLGRVRWLFLVFVLANLIPPVHAVVTSDTAGARTAGVLALAFLAVWWLRGYLNEGFPPLGVPLEAGALLFVGLAAGAEELAALFYSGLFFRSLYGRGSTVIVCAVAFIAAFGVASYVGPGPSPVDDRAVLGQIPGLAMVAGVMHVLSRTLERFRSIVKNSSDVIMIVGRDSLVSFQTPSAERTFGYGPGELVGAQLLDLLHPDDREGATALLKVAAAQPGLTGPAEWRLRHRDGSWLWVETVANNLLEDPHVGGLLLATRNVSDRKALEEQLVHQAFHDTLTGLPNRALFRDRLEHALHLGLRAGPPPAVLCLDLDDFKTVNDSLGHPAGDLLLVDVTARLQACLRPSDTAARLGGDEFAVLLEHPRDLDEVVQVAERVLAAVAQPFELEGRERLITASIGIALGDKRGDELLRDADVALYTAKARGKRRLAFFEPDMHAAVVARFELKAGLEHALDGGQLSILYQPTVDLESRRVCGAEALLRWHHPERGTLLPDEFISLAEETGLVVPIGGWVLETACREAAGWNALCHDRLAPLVTVNVSAGQLERPAFVRQVSDVLDSTGLAPQRLVLELTESIAMQESSIERLAELKALGVGLAIDDFGTGYSSLGYLERLPVDMLKIDKAFVDGIGGQGVGGAVAAAVLGLATALELDTVAEGIEREEQREELIELGCHGGQGFLFAEPMRLDEFEALLTGERFAGAALRR